MTGSSYAADINRTAKASPENAGINLVSDTNGFAASPHRR